MGIKPIILALLLIPATVGTQAQNTPKPVDLPIPSKWVLVWGEYQGDKFKDPTEFELKADGTGSLLFSGDTFSLKYELDRRPDPLRIDMDMSWTGHRNVPPIAHAGIYRYDGFHLTVCMGWTEKAGRPTDFRTTHGDGRLLLVLKQKK